LIRARESANLRPVGDALPETNAVMTGLVPVTHVVKPLDIPRLAGTGAAWMTGTSPVMTERAV
jgi:hypothetical protein